MDEQESERKGGARPPSSVTRLPLFLLRLPHSHTHPLTPTLTHSRTHTLTHSHTHRPPSSFRALEPQS